MPVTQLAVDSARFREGIKLFNSGEFFEAHEVLEDVWCAAPAAEKRFLQGLIQVAVALHHHSKENRVGARSLLARARRNLSGYPEDRKSTRLNSSHTVISYAVFCLKKKKKNSIRTHESAEPRTMTRS